MGPQILPPPAREKTFRRLGMPPLPEDGNYFLSWTQWVGSHPEAFDEPNGAPMTKDAKHKVWDKVNTAATMPWREANEPALAAWLRDNAGAMELVQEASRLPRFYLGFIPTGEPGLATRDILFYPQKPIGDAFASRIMLRIESNDIAGAWSDILTLSRLGRLLSQDPRPSRCSRGSNSTLRLRRRARSCWRESRRILRRPRPCSPRHRPSRHSRSLRTLWTVGRDSSSWTLSHICTGPARRVRSHRSSRAW